MLSKLCLFNWLNLEKNGFLEMLKDIWYIFFNKLVELVFLV